MFTLINAASWISNNPRRARLIILAVTVVVLAVLAFGPAAIAQAGPATGGSVCPGC